MEAAADRPATAGAPDGAAPTAVWRSPGVWAPSLFTLVLGLESMLRMAGWRPWLLVLLLGQCLPLLWRHSAPRSVFALVLLASTLQLQTPYVTNAFVGAHISLASLVQQLRRPVSVAPAIVLFAIHTVASFDLGAVIVLTHAAAAVVAWFFGDLMARERVVARVLATRLERLSRGERVRSDAAVLEERLRIGRELHAVVGRALDAVVVQADAASALLREGRGGVADLLQKMEETGRAALTELDRLLRLLRPVTPPPPAPDDTGISSELVARRWTGPLQSGLALVAPTLVLGSIGVLRAADAVVAQPELGVLPYVLAVGATLPLLVRWWFPLTVTLWITGLIGVFQWRHGMDLDNVILAIPVALHAVAVVHPERRSKQALLAVLVLQLPVGIATAGPARWELALVVAGFCFVAWRMGAASRRARLHADALRERTEQLATERKLRLERALSAERMEIAREVHDSVGHTLSMVVLVAGAARASLDADPARAGGALDTLTTAARATLADMDRITGLLSSPASTSELSPRLDDLEELAERLRGTGTSVHVTFEGEPALLPETLQACLYRIAQEALTNVAKHADARRCDVVVTITGADVELTVLDDGTAHGLPIASGGRGTIGMRERAELFGGQLRHGPRATGGYAVNVTLPRARDKVPA